MDKHKIIPNPNPTNPVRPTNTV